MLKKMVNHAQVELEISPVDPLLVKSGQATVSGVDMAFVQTYYGSQEGSRPYIPGSSLKGVIRSYAEKICRTLRPVQAPVCLPYLDPDKAQGPEADQVSCGFVFEKYKKVNKVKTIPGHDVYRSSCPACRLFGSHDFIGRFAASDAHLTDSNYALEIRNGVAIDRFTGGTVGSALYDFEVLVRGTFKATLEVRNFERWQIGLLGLVLRDMEEKLVRIGFGKSRGLGRIQAAITRFSLAYYAAPAAGLAGLFAQCTPVERTEYGLFEETPQPATLPAPEQKGLRCEYDITGSWKDVLAPAVADLQAYISCVSWPGALQGYLGRNAKKAGRPS